MEFDYCNVSGERRVTIEPYLIVFQWSNWYIFGYEPVKAAFRMFKLNRLRNLHVTEQVFTLREIPQEKWDFNRYFTEEIHAVILFDESVKYRLLEEYGTDCLTISGEGKIRFEFSFTNKEYLLEWLLGFEDKAELLEPYELREELKNVQKVSF